MQWPASGAWRGGGGSKSDGWRQHKWRRRRQECSNRALDMAIDNGKRREVRVVSITFIVDPFLRFCPDKTRVLTRLRSSVVELELEFFGPAKELEPWNSIDLELQFDSNSIGKIVPKHKNWNWSSNSNSTLQFYGEPNVSLVLLLQVYIPSCFCPKYTAQKLGQQNIIDVAGAIIACL